MPATIPQPPDIPPQPRHRPQLPPAHWPVIFAFLAARGLPLWIA